MQKPSFIHQVGHDFHHSWKQLVLTDIVYKLIAFIVLAPLAGLLFRLLVSLSGRHVLADDDIAHFLLEPIGWICLISLAAVWITIFALEQAALLQILRAADFQQQLYVSQALKLAFAQTAAVLRITVLLALWTVAVALPFLAAAGLTYLLLLTQFDINYYLTHKPLAYQVAVGIAGLLGLGLAVVLARLVTNWFLALPLVIFEGLAPRRALRTSGERIRGSRRVVLFSLLAWAILFSVVAALASGAVVALARWMVPDAAGSLSLILLCVGATLVASLLVNLAVNVLSTISFAAIFYRLYARYGAGADGVPKPPPAAGAARTDKPGIITRRRLAVGLLLAVVVAGGIGYAALRGVQTDDQVEIIAHRGASGSAPENTMAAIQQAVRDQTDWVEIDVQETSDGQVVVMHDSDFKKIANHDLKIWDATLDSLATIDIGSWFDPEFADQRVPKLADVLTYCQGKAKVMIELKYYGHDERLEQRVVEIVEEAGMQREIAIISLKQDGLQKIKQLRPDWRTGLLTAVALGDLSSVDADFLAVNASLANRALIRSAHQRDKQVLAWTVNDPITMSTLMGRGVDGLITDRPGLVREVMETRKSLSSVERLLLEFATFLGIEREIADQ